MQCVITPAEASELKRIEIGIPREFKLGPLIFNVCISDIPLECHEKKSVMLANDFKKFSEIHSENRGSCVKHLGNVKT